MHKPPPPPQLDAPYPYEWAYVRKWNAPMWWRVPDAEERERANALRAGRESERTGEPLPDAAPANQTPSS